MVTTYVVEQLGQYTLTQVLGRGGSAIVHLGRHTRLGTYTAVKVLRTSVLPEQAEKQFRFEAQTMARLQHRHIVRILDFSVENSISYIVMDYAPNGSLRKRHPIGTRVPLNTAVSYAGQVAKALQYAHDRGIIHRDVKPENMLLGFHNEVLLTDFGIAVVKGESGGMLAPAGTIPYMAPEQIRGRPCKATDQYALAAVIYEWLTGMCPFRGRDKWAVAYKHLHVPPPSMRRVVPSIPPAVERVIMKALSKDPRQRYPSVLAFAYALERAASGQASLRKRTSALKLRRKQIIVKGRDTQLPRTNDRPGAEGDQAPPRLSLKLKVLCVIFGMVFCWIALLLLLSLLSTR